MTEETGTARVAALLEDVRTCMLTTTDDGGELVSRPMAVQEVEFDGDLWFFAEGDSRKVAHVRARPGVGAAFSSASTWISVAGHVEVVDVAQARAKAEELWNPVVEAWFPDGLDSPRLVLLKLHADTAEYWDTPGGRVASVISFVKAKATGEPYDGGDHEVVDLQG